jgi:hypothetical protein
LFFLILDSVFTSNLLVFSWNSLKVNKYFIFLSKDISYPITKIWINKTSFLIRKGRFIYKPFFRNFSIYRLRFRIIENAFFLILKPFFYKFFIKRQSSYNHFFNRGINFYSFKDFFSPSVHFTLSIVRHVCSNLKVKFHG